MMANLMETIYVETRIEHSATDQHIPCLAHIINLVVGAFLKNLKVIGDVAECHDDEDIQHRIQSGSKKDFALTMLKV
jgi:hypothetical protein